MGERPFQLECWEMDPDAAELAWRPWSTYVTVANALERRDKLVSKGHTARVVDLRTGAVVEGATVATCNMCGDEHAGPYDGRCLL